MTVAVPDADQGGSNLITLVNRLQDTLLATGSARGHQLALDLPQIAVVGAQSAGKSSVLEAFVGRDFLPRGTGICTRRPLVLQLVQSRETDSQHEYAIFSHSSHTYDNFDDVRREIQRQTDSVAGTDKGVSPQPINLKIYSPNVIDLTLVDLPVPVGDQPSDIETIIRQMCLSFIERDNCLILAVSPANADLATSDALQLAQSVDPDGDRTIGVLTKLDIVDDGTDVRPVLDNKVIPLQFGFIGVVCRSQKQIDSNTRMAQAQAAEATFFKSHPSYQDMADRCGTGHLRQQLHNLLLAHIGQRLPDFKLGIQAQLSDLESQLSECQLPFDYANPHWRAEALTAFVLRWADALSTQLIGNSDVGLNLNSLTPGARIARLFGHTFRQNLMSTEFTEETQLKLEIGFTIQCILGVRSGLFTPNQAFESVVRKQIFQMRDALEQLVVDVSSEMRGAVSEACVQAGVDKFPALEAALSSAADRHIEARREAAHDAVLQLVDFERAYINTRHEDFVGFSYAEEKAFSRVLKRRNPGAGAVMKGMLRNQDSLDAWHVLTPDSLSWYSDDSERVRLYTVPISDVSIRFEHVRANRFRLTSEHDNLVLDRAQLDLAAPDASLMHQWRQAFIRVGIYDADTSTAPANETSTSSKVLQTNDPVLERQIESVFLLVDSYMQIVCRTFMDLAPKCIVRVLIKDSIEHFRHKLLAELSRHARVDELLEEDSVAVEQRRQLEQQIDICRQTLDVLLTIKIPVVQRRKKLVVGPTKLSTSGESSTTRNRPPPLPDKPKPKLSTSEQKLSTKNASTNSLLGDRKSSARGSTSSQKERKKLQSESRAETSKFFV